MIDHGAGQDMPTQSKSKVDEALGHLNETIEELNQNLSRLETRLTPVLNNTPRPSLNEIKEDDSMVKEPTGDSHILSRIYSLHNGLTKHIDSIQVLVDRLDI